MEVKPKYWAYYGTVGEFDLITNAAYENIEANSDYDYSAANRRLKQDLRPYPTLAAAKKFLRMHLNGDISDCKSALLDLRQFKAKGKK